MKGGLGTERLLNMFLIKFSPQNFRLKPWKFSFIQCIEFPWGAAESEGPIRRSSLLIRLDYKVQSTCGPKIQGHSVYVPIQAQTTIAVICSVYSSDN